MTASPAGRWLGFSFATEPGGSFTADDVVEFLRGVLRHLPGDVVVVLDRGSNGRGPGTGGCGWRCPRRGPRS